MKRVLVSMMLATLIVCAVVLLTQQTVKADIIVFTTQLLASNEVSPVVVDPSEQMASGTAVVTLDTSSGTMSFEVTINGLASNVILAHIHEGGAAVNGPVRVDSGITPGTSIAPINGTVQFTRTGLAVDPGVMAAIIANPGNFYFNVHTALSPGGVARGQLAVLQITCPANITVSNAPDQCGAVVNYPPPSANGAGVICSPASGSFFPVGTTTVNCRTTVCSFVYAAADNTIITFDPTTPGSISIPVPVTGLGKGENLVGIDVRPATGQLYGLLTSGTDARLVTIDPATGATTQVGAAFILNGTGFGFDFNPLVDLIRLVSDAEENLVLNPTTGAVTVQTALNPAGDVVGAAYSNNFPGSSTTTLYTIDSGTDSLQTQTPPASGTQTVVGALGVDTSSVVGFDISACDVAYAALNQGGDTGFYTVNLTSGAATLVGTIGGEITVQGIAVVRPPSCSFTITVVDTQPPIITCPTNIVAVAQQTCPPTVTSTVVTFPPPNASDNCPGVTVACVPPSGSPLPVGTSTVTCTATDAVGNTATCSFSVAVFDGCLQDDSNPAVTVLFNTTTGEYLFCCNGTTFSGTGTVMRKGCVVTIQHNPADRRVMIKSDSSVKSGHASLQSPPGVTRCTIMDRNTANNTCACGTPVPK